ncbi:hypothetical protein ARMGADRAFT_1105128 [Armillaria gallica]|uniref:Uncharacterized protein n=1 Tax=Armillaria gallica TaxID=47427 RepID=A0A2H3DF05_ARMGA|nr:hypothetical protein ARMGADRAFT_1105128 [Armillaria gallica]
MKISLELDVVVAFIKEVSDNPSVWTPKGWAFLSAVVNSIQTSVTTPERRSKKQKHDADKEGGRVYMDKLSSTSPTRNKKPKTDRRNAMAKNAAAIPRKIDIMGMPSQGIKSKLRSASPSTMSMVKADTAGKNKGEANQDGRTMVREAMVYLKEWEWPIMGRKSTWATDSRPLAPTFLASRCIMTLSTIKQEDNQQKLWKLLNDISKLHQVKDTVSGHEQRQCSSSSQRIHVELQIIPFGDFEGESEDHWCYTQTEKQQDIQRITMDGSII